MRYLFLILMFAGFSYAQVDSNKCFPNCRFGFTCIDGDCISSCNPPCPEGYVCANSYGCISMEKYEDLTETHSSKVVLTSSAAVAGLLMAIGSFVIKEDPEKGFDKKNITGLRIGGPIIMAVSVPFNFMTWQKFKQSAEFRKHNRTKSHP